MSVSTHFSNAVQFSLVGLCTSTVPPDRLFIYFLMSFHFFFRISFTLLLLIHCRTEFHVSNIGAVFFLHNEVIVGWSCGAKFKSRIAFLTRSSQTINVSALDLKKLDLSLRKRCRSWIDNNSYLSKYVWYGADKFLPTGAL